MSLYNGHTNEISSRLTSIDSQDSQSGDRRSSIQRNRSFDNMVAQKEANVLVIYTGGTIGMTRNSNNGKTFGYDIGSI